ncbi:TolC family protein [Vibrio sp. RC27]
MSLSITPLPSVAEESVMLSSPNDVNVGLIGALKATLEHNPAVKGQNTQLAIQDSQIDAAKAGRYPSLNGSITTQGDNASFIEVAQPLWAFGKIDATIEAAKSNYTLEEQALLQVKRELMESTATAYTQVLSARYKLDVSTRNVETYQQLFGKIKRRHRGQLASYADVNLAESRLLQATADKFGYEAELQSALNELNTLTRVETTAELAIDSALLQLPSSERLKQLTLENSSDIAHAAQLIELAKSQHQQKKSALFPTVSLKVQQYLNNYYDNETRVGLVVEGSLEGMGAAGLSQAQGAEMGIVAAEYEYDSVRNEVERETQNLFLNASLQQQLRESQLKSVASLEKTMSSFLRQYETSRKTWVEVLNQQRELTTMRYSLIETDQQFSALTLKLAIMAGQLDRLTGVAR